MIADIKLPSYSKISPSFLVIPMISHWILPSAIEIKLYVNILGIPFYCINLFYVLYIASYFKNKNENNAKLKFQIKYLCCLFGYICLLSGLWNDSEPLLPILFNAYPIIWLVPVMILCPLNENQIQLTKYVMAFALLFLCIEVLLYATGTLSYRSTSTNALLTGQEYAGGIMRISTTIGGATGTAIIIVWLGALCISVYKFCTFIKWSLFILSTITVFYTVSRGSIIVWILYSIYYFYKYYLQYRSFKVKILAILSALIVTGGLNYFSVFDAVLDRNEQLSNNMTTGRDVHIERSIRIIEESHGFGVGPAMMFPEKSIQNIVTAKKKEASHNAFFIIIGEMGFIGLLLFLAIIILILSNISYGNPLSIFVWLALLINFNTEGVVLMSEFMALFIFILMTQLKQESHETYSVYFKT